MFNLFKDVFDDIGITDEFIKRRRDELQNKIPEAIIASEEKSNLKTLVAFLALLIYLIYYKFYA